MSEPRRKTQSAGFDVTCIVGRVTFDDDGAPPNEVAFGIIARADFPGVYTFPRPEGTCVVEVTHELA